MRKSFSAEMFNKERLSAGYLPLTRKKAKCNCGCNKCKGQHKGEYSGSLLSEIFRESETNSFERNNKSKFNDQEIEHFGPIGAISGMVYRDIVIKIEAQLNLKFSNPDDPRLYERRKELKRLFDFVPDSYAKTLFDQLQKKSDSLGRLFRYKLSTSTRNEMLGILQKKISGSSVPPAVPSSSTVPPKPKPPDLRDVILDLLFHKKPLPSSLESEFQKAAKRFISILQGQSQLSGTITQVLICMLKKLLLSGSDDRVVEWGKICPSQSGNIMGLPSYRVCGLGIPADEDLLQRSILTKADVEQANEQFSAIRRFIDHLKPDILNLHLMYNRPGDEAAILKALRELVVQRNLTVNRLNAMFQPDAWPLARPRYLLAIKDWIAQKQDESKSVYSCF